MRERDRDRERYRERGRERKKCCGNYGFLLGIHYTEKRTQNDDRKRGPTLSCMSYRDTMYLKII